MHVHEPPTPWPEHLVEAPAQPFGLAALEALASGAALICTRQGALPEVAGEAALYVEPADPAQLAAAITSLATDPGLDQPAYLLTGAGLRPVS